MDLEKSKDIDTRFCSIIYTIVFGLAILILGIHFVYVTADMVKRLMYFYTRFSLIVIPPTKSGFISYVIIPTLFFGYLLCLAKVSVWLMRIFLRQLKKFGLYEE